MSSWRQVGARGTRGGSWWRQQWSPPGGHDATADDSRWVDAKEEMEASDSYAGVEDVHYGYPLSSYLLCRQIPQKGRAR